MKKNILILITIISLTFSNEIKGQNICKLTLQDLYIESCISSYSNYSDNLSANFVVNNILHKLNLKNDIFIVKVCHGLNNCIAFNRQNNRFIIIDDEWVESIKYGNEDWIHLFAISHEIAHHIFGHTIKASTNLYESRIQELEADEFAGYIISQYGATEENTEIMMKKFPDDNDPRSDHPTKKQRLESINKGIMIGKQKSSAIFIQKLSNGTKFNIKTTPYLESIARENFSYYLSKKNKESFNTAIESYKECLRFTNDPEMIYELGILNFIAGDFKTYSTTLEYCFKTSKDESYLLELIGTSIEQDDFSKLNQLYCDYHNILDNISVYDKYQARTINSIFKFYLYMIKKNKDLPGLDQTYVIKAKKLFENQIHIKTSELQNLDQTNCKAQLLSGMGLIELWSNNFDSAENYFLESLNYFKIGQTKDYYLEEFFLYYTINYLNCYYNLALCCVRNRNWSKGQRYIDAYQQIIHELNTSQLEYLTKYNERILFNTYYLSGRIQHANKNYNLAIEYYSKAIKFDKEPYYLYYYRGISYLGINEKKMANMDFEFACKNNYQPACSRLIK